MTPIVLLVTSLTLEASVVCLVQSYRTAGDHTQRNQVKWILFGSLVALVPIGYSFYIAVWEKNDFAAGTTTSRLTIGSSRTGRAARTAFLKATRPAVLKAASELSTGWSLPKKTSTATS